MAKVDQVKALIQAFSNQEEDRFFAVALQVAADEARLGHVRRATELRDLVEGARERRALPSAKPTLLAQPRGELAELLAVHYPDHHLNQMVLCAEVERKLRRVLKEQREHAKLSGHGLHPRRKLLLTGPPGTGKTFTAAVLAAELKLPLFTARFDSLITKFMGESASKLRVVFDAIRQTRGVYLFDEFDSLGLRRGSQHDVAEMRRTLNMFLQLLEQDRSESLIVAATNHGESLDFALFRRFDDVIRYELPNREQIELLLHNRLALMANKTFPFELAAEAGLGLSHSDIVRASQDALKDAVLASHAKVSVEDVIAHLRERIGAQERLQPQD